MSIYVKEVVHGNKKGYTDTINYAPLWVRRYFGGAREHVWSYLGASLSRRYVDEYGGPTRSKETTSFIPVAEAGLDMGGRAVRAFLGVKFFPGDEDTQTLLLNIGFNVRLGR
jgi:hypothetical protein